MPSTNSKTTSNALLSRPANSSYSARSRSRIVLTAERLSSDVPVPSANSASMSRVESPRASIATANSSSALVRPRSVSRIGGRNGWARPAICGALYSIVPSALFNRPVRSPLRQPASGAAPRA
jgi:hypothetical protein